MPQRNGHTRKATSASRTRTKDFPSAGQHVREVADQVMSRAEAGLQAAQESTEAYVKEGRQKLNAVSESLLQRVHDNPLRALAIAAGAGAALMLLLRRR